MPRRACQFTGSGQIRLLVMTLYFLMVFSPAIVVSQAQVTQTTRAGGNLDTHVTLNGNTFEIRGGTPVEKNLFHSFDSFSIEQVQTAKFLKQGFPGADTATINNLISRVIGNGVNPIATSRILGIIDTTSFGGANFWMINPAGFVIGPNAVFNIGGTINLASANYLQLGTARFNAANESISGAVLKANPTAWGFLGATPTSGATIQLNGGQFNNGQTLTVVGRDSQAGANGVEVGGSITIPGGTVKLGSVGKLANGVTSGEMSVGSLAATGFESLGSVRMTSGAGINVNQNTGGSVFIRGHELVMVQNSHIDADTINGQGGGIDIQVQDLTLTDAILNTRVTGSGQGGNTKITAGTITMTNSIIDNGNFFTGVNQAQGNGSSLTINADRMTMTGGIIYGDTFGPGQGANITLNVVKGLILQDHALIQGGTQGDGRAGNITLNVDTLMAKGATLFSGSQPSCPGCSMAGNAGPAGTITIAAASSVTLDNTKVTNTVVDGSGKPITITAGTITLLNGTKISADTAGIGNAGTITLQAERLLANVDPTSEPSARKPLENVSNVEISSSTTESGSAGIITFEGLSLNRPITELTMAKTRVETEAGGNGTTGAGSAIRVNAPSGTVNLYQTVFSANVAGGTDQFNAPPPPPTNLNIVDGGLSTANITVTAKDLTMKGGGLTAQTSGGRRAGNIALNVDRLTTEQGSTAIEVVKDQLPTDRVVISSSSLGPQTTGNAGQIRIGGTDTTASQLKPVSGPVSLSDTDISTASLGTGSGGPITIQSAGNITLTDTVLSANVNSGTNDSSGILTGNILVATPKHLSIVGGGITAQTTGSRHAGNIALSVGSLTTAKGSLSIQPPWSPANQKDRVVISSSSTGHEIDSKGIVHRPATGNAGRVWIGGIDSTDTTLTAVPGSVSLSDTNITTEAKGTGAGGQISIRSASSMVMTQSNLSATVRNTGVDAREANIQLTTPSLNMTGGGIIAQTHGSRNAGNITLNVGSLKTVKGSAEIPNDTSQTNRVVLSSSSTGFDADGDGSVINVQKGDILATGDAGTITIRGLDGVTPVPGPISLSDVNIASRAIHTGAGGTISIASNQTITLKDVFLSTSVRNLPSGSQNDPTKLPTITLITPDLRISGRDVNNRPNDSPMREINVDQQGGQILAETSGTRDSGNILLHVGQLTIDQHPVTRNGVTLSSSSTGVDNNNDKIIDIFATGNAGTITLRGLDGKAAVPGPISIKGAEIRTVARGTGQGGLITIQSSENITLTDTVLSANVNDGINDSSGVPTGNILVSTQKQLSIVGGGITAQTTGSRHAGNITLSAENLTTSKGNARFEFVKGQPTGRVVISSSSTGLDTDGNGTLNTFATGNAGQVLIGKLDKTGTQLTAVPGVVSLGDTDISTAAEGTGLGGPITIQASSPMTLTHSTLSANVHNTATSDPSGANIVLTAPSVTMTGGGITAQTTGSRNAGTITLNVDALTTQAGTVAGGLLTNRVLLSSSSLGSGDAGTVTIKGSTNAVTSKPIVLNGTGITTESNATGKGGSITIEAAEDITLTDTVLSANVNKGTDIGGVSSSNIMVKTPKHLTISGGGITAQTIGTRHAGQIDLLVGSLTTSNFQGNRVSISSSSLGSATTGNAGQVQIGNLDITGMKLTAVPGVVSLGDTDISTAAEGTGLGGPITILTSSPMNLTHSTLSANVHNTATSDPSGANILLAAPSLTVTGGGITAQTTGSRNAGTITLNVDTFTSQAGTKDIVVGGSTTKRVQLSSSSLGRTTEGNAGQVQIGKQDKTGTQLTAVPGVVSLGDTDISTAAEGTGLGGPITILASSPMTLTHSTLSANVHNTATSDPSGANILLTAPSVTMTGGGITAQTTGSRNAGTITLNVDALTTQAGTKDIVVGGSTTKRVQLSSSSLGRTTEGNAGQVQIGGVDSTDATLTPVPGLVSLRDADISTVAEGTGVGGSIRIGSGTAIDLFSTSKILSTVNNLPAAGAASAPANIELRAPIIRVVGSNILANTIGSRDAGTITLQADALIPNANFVTTNSLTGQTKSFASNGTVNPSLIQLTGNSQVKTTSSGPGSGGSINMNATNITITDRTEVSASSAPIPGQTGVTGAAGSIVMDAANQYQQSGGAKVTTETVGAASRSSGGGGITIFARKGDVSLTEGAQISASSKNDGTVRNLRDAGTISVTAGRDIQMRSGSTIETDANAALGGKIILESPNFFHAHDSTITSSVDGAKGSNAGTIDITGQRFQLFENTHISTNATQGDGGLITFKAGVSLQDANSRIEAHSETGRNGTVDIQAPVKVLSGTIVPVRPFFAQAALSTDRCSADPAGKFSSFTQGKRDGLPQEPGRFAPSPLTLEQLEAPGQARDLNRPILQAKRLNVPMLTIAVDPQLALTSGMGCGGV